MTTTFNELLHEALIGFIVRGRAGGSSNRFNLTLIVYRVCTAEIPLLLSVHLLKALNKKGEVVNNRTDVSYVEEQITSIDDYLINLLSG